MKTTLLEFAAVNDTAAATPKKLVKQDLLAKYFQLLDEPDLRWAVRYSAGRPFPATDERTLNVGSAIVGDVALSMLPVSAAAFHDKIVRSGEMGEAMSTLWPVRPPGEKPVVLSDLADAFDALAGTGNVENKKQILHTLLSRCDNGREAAYLAKIIFGDLRTGVQEGLLQAAVATAFAKPLPAVQRCQLLVGDLDEVAVLAKRDALESAKFRLFHPVQFMLATPQDTAEIAAVTFDGRTFFAEDKLDGIRAQVHKQADRIAIYTRTMDRTDESFPDVVTAVSKLPGDFLLDGEIVPYRDGQVLPFAHIQKRLGRKALTAKMLADNPAVFIPFDVLYLDGRLLMDDPWRDRRAALDAFLTPKPTVDVKDVAVTHAGPTVRDGAVAGPLLPTPVATAEQIQTAFEKSRQSRNEGLILKDPESPYSPGRRGKMWLKLKTHLPTFDCVVTAAEHGHGKRKNSLSDYTFAVWDRPSTDPAATLVNLGKAYSGVTDVEIAQLTKLFLELSVGNNGRVHQVKPQVVFEIAADQVQKSNRHAGGFALRFPRIKRIRWDKKPADADTLQRVAEVYESVHNFGRSGAADIASAEPTLFDGM